MCTSAGYKLTTVSLVTKVVPGIVSVRIQLRHASYRTNPTILSPLHESTTQRVVSKHYQCGGYITVLLIKAWNYKIHHYTYHGYSPNEQIWCRNPGILVWSECTVYAAHSLAAFNTSCVVRVRRTSPSSHSATLKTFWLSPRRESRNSKRSASDSKWWRSYSSAVLSLADWMKWDVTVPSCTQSWYRFKDVISKVGRCFSIPLLRSSFYMPQMLWTKCCFAALLCSSRSLWSTSVGLQWMLLQCIALHNWLSLSCFHS
jgi:hypothetical protein